MNNLYLTDEDIHGCEENETEILLRNRLDKANKRIEILEDIIENVSEVITRDLHINERWLDEETPSSVRMLLISMIKYDNTLLDLLREE